MRPDSPVCRGCFSLGIVDAFCDEKLSGYRSLLRLAERHGFDPRATPWAEMTEAARHAFVFGDPVPYSRRPGEARRMGGPAGDAERVVLAGHGPVGTPGPRRELVPSERVRCLRREGPAARVPHAPAAGPRPRRPVPALPRGAGSRPHRDRRPDDRHAADARATRACADSASCGRSASGTSTSSGGCGRCRPARRNGSSWPRCSAASCSA